MNRGVFVAFLFWVLFHVSNARKTWERSLEKLNITEAIVVNKEWNCSLPAGLLDQDISEDRALYNDTSLFFLRRTAAKQYLEEPGWSRLIAKAWWEIATDNEGATTQKIRHNGLYDSLLDFVEHIHYFETVRDVMHQRGKDFFISGEQHSGVHDVDKLHPIMLAAYAEKFEDQKDTYLWETCVNHHIYINPHHQGNPLWQDGHCSRNGFRGKSCDCYEHLCFDALLEMICDKVSRKAQKELKGKLSEEMWDVDPKFFLGLPDPWLKEAYLILEEFKRT